MIAKDKQYHVAAGLIICLTVAAVTKNLTIGFFAAVVAGAAKEGYDYVVNLYLSKQGKPPAHDVDFMDFFATAVGGALMVTILLLVDMLK